MWLCNENSYKAILGFFANINFLSFSEDLKMSVFEYTSQHSELTFLRSTILDPYAAFR